MKNFYPKCCHGEIELAVTNNGYLIPCCYVDTPGGMSDLEIKKLLKTSKISKTNTIGTILDSKEWQNFEKILTGDGPYPNICMANCALEKTNLKRKYTVYKNGEKVKDIKQ